MLRENFFYANLATTSADVIGVGGAVFMRNATGAQVLGNIFQNNIAAKSGDQGVGGAFMGDTNNGLELIANTFVANAAAADVEAQGIGGGAYLIDSQPISVAANIFQNNVAGVNNYGLGGGLYLFRVTDATLVANDFNSNWGVFNNYFIARAPAWPSAIRPPSR